MSDPRQPLRPTRRGWENTAPGDLPDAPAAQPAKPAAAKSRAQPPLQEVLKGLDARELEGQTVFDQLFGVELPPAPPAPAAGKTTKKPAR